MLIVYSNPLPRQNDGMNLSTHSNTIAAVSRLGLGLPGSAARSRNTRQIVGPAMPIKKLNTIINKFAMLGDLNLNERMYVNPAEAGPKSINKAKVVDEAPLSVVMNDSTSKAYIKATTTHRGI